MAAYIPFFELWTQSGQDAERKIQKFLLSGLDKVGQAESDILAKIKDAPDINIPLARWMEEADYPTFIEGQLATAEITVNGKIFGQTATEILCKQILRVGTVLERNDGTGLQARVSSIAGLSSTPPTFTVAAHGNNILSDDTSATTRWDILSELWTDQTNAGEGRGLDRFFRHVGTQIFEEDFVLLKTRQNTKYEIVEDEFNHQMEALLRKLRRQQAYAVVRIEPKYSGGYIFGDQSEESALCGMLTWPKIVQSDNSNPSIYVNKAGADLVKSDIDNLVRNAMLTENANYNVGDWWIVCHPNVHKYLQDFDISYRRTTKDEKSVGFEVDHFDAKIGKSFPIMSERYMREGVLLVVNFNAFKKGYYQNDTMDRKEIPQANRSRKWMISFQMYGVVCRSPRQNISMIYGLPIG